MDEKQSYTTGKIIEVFKETEVEDLNLLEIEMAKADQAEI